MSPKRTAHAPKVAHPERRPAAFPRRVGLMLEPLAGETLDSIGAGDIQLLQRAQGYRFNLDPVLLAHFAAQDVKAPPGPLIDLGTGSGIIPILLARKFNRTHLTGVELQPTLFALAQRNVQLNRCERRISLVQGDLRRAADTFEAGGFGHVVCNPPFTPLAAGNRNPQPEKAIARFEVQCTLADVAQAAHALLRHGGALSLVYPSGRLVEALHVLRGARLEPKLIRLVHPRAAEPAKRVLLSAVKGGRADLTVLPPLALHEPKGDAFTAEVQEMVG